MRKLIQFLTVLFYFVCGARADRRYVNYTVLHHGCSSHDRVNCAKASADNVYFAARIDDVSGLCEGLTWDWGANPVYDQGFSYIKKTKTVEIFEPVAPVDALTFDHWLIPGKFGTGGLLEFYMTVPTDSNWTAIVIDLADTADLYFDQSDAIPEYIITHMRLFKIGDAFEIKTYDHVLDHWEDRHIIQPFPFVDGQLIKISLIPLLDVMKVLIDDVVVVHFSHLIGSDKAKLLRFYADANSAFKLHNFTFVGV